MEAVKLNWKDPGARAPSQNFEHVPHLNPESSALADLATFRFRKDPSREILVYVWKMLRPLCSRHQDHVPEERQSIAMLPVLNLGHIDRQSGANESRDAGAPCIKCMSQDL